MNVLDLERVQELRSVVRWSADPMAFELLRGVSDARWAVAELASGSRGGSLAGMVGAVPLGEIGVLCHLAVRHDCREKGIGRTLTRWAVTYLRSSGVREIRLDSTPRAERLYGSMGFTPEGARTVYRLEAAKKTNHGRSSGVGIAPLLARDLPELYGVDRWSFGGDRSPLIFATIRLHPGNGLVARDTNGQIKGYLIRTISESTTRIGPFMADDEEVARSLLIQALGAAHEAPVEITVTEGSPAHSLLPDLGFTGSPDRLRMMLGEGPPAKGLRDYGSTPYLAT